MENEDLNNELVVEENEVLEQTNESENVDTQTTEEVVEQTEDINSNEAKKKSLSEILKEDPELQKEFNETIQKRLKRKENSIEREFRDKYGKIERTLKSGLETDNLDEISKKLDEFYIDNGKEIPKEPEYSEREAKILADAEANEIIECGYDDIVDELHRLTEKGAGNMSYREKLIFKKLDKEMKLQESEKELASLGISRENLDNDKFKDFEKKLNPELSLKEKFEIYSKLNPKETPKPIGSMKDTVTKKEEVKDFYTYDEAKNFTREDFKKNPKLFKAVEKSMPLWGKK